MKILIFDHNSDLVELLDYLRQAGVQLELKKPMTNLNPKIFDGIIAPGGSLPRENYREILKWYIKFLNRIKKPFLGICLGQKIIGYCYGARIRKIPKEEEIITINFHKQFPLAPNVKELNVFESHEFELISPLPNTLENYASSGKSIVQAIKVCGKEQYAVQFHPERKGNEGHIILDNFIARAKQI